MATEEESYKSDSYCLLLRADGGEELIERVSCCKQSSLHSSYTEIRCTVSIVIRSCSSVMRQAKVRSC